MSISIRCKFKRDMDLSFADGHLQMSHLKHRIFVGEGLWPSRRFDLITLLLSFAFSH